MIADGRSRKPASLAESDVAALGGALILPVNLPRRIAQPQREDTSTPKRRARRRIFHRSGDCNRWRLWRELASVGTGSRCARQAEKAGSESLLTSKGRPYATVDELIFKRDGDNAFGDGEKNSEVKLTIEDTNEFGNAIVNGAGLADPKSRSRDWSGQVAPKDQPPGSGPKSSVDSKELKDNAALARGDKPVEFGLVAERETEMRQGLTDGLADESKRTGARSKKIEKLSKLAESESKERVEDLIEEKVAGKPAQDAKPEAMKQKVIEAYDFYKSGRYDLAYKRAD
jgi:hypothetical protein